MTHRVLIVDDDPAQRRLLDSMIRRCGHDTLLADSAAAALDLLAQPRARPIDLIVLDLVMPGMDGLELLSRLDGMGSHIPVIVQTAQGSIETVVKAMRAGADDFVVKPVSPERLKVSMQNLLQGQCPDRGGEAPQQEGRRSADLRRSDRHCTGHGKCRAAGASRCPVEHPDPDRRRIGRRQGDDRPRHPGRERPPRPAFRRRQLRRHPGKPGREHPVRS